MIRIFLVAGESSGDIHGGHLVQAIRDEEPTAVCEGLGGKLMAAAGMDLRYDLAGQAIMGFTEIVASFRQIRRLFLDTVAYLAEVRPDCLVVIDYPGFNIRLARRAKALGIPVVYYISPQVWAWRRNRVHTIAKLVEKMLVILPFEEPLYRAAGVDCVYVGHPLLDHVASADLKGEYRGGLVVGLLPGSREQEIRRLAAPMMEVAQGIQAHHPEARFIVPCVDEARKAQIQAAARDFPLEVAVGKTYEVLGAARLCLVASGTATVETALFGVPMVILYRVSPLTYWLARGLVHVDHIGMVNILAGRRIVPEFIQRDVRPDRILPVALELIDDTPARRQMLADLADVRAALGQEGASRRAADAVLEVARRRQRG